jgi:hypothetical protein
MTMSLAVNAAAQRSRAPSAVRGAKLGAVSLGVIGGVAGVTEAMVNCDITPCGVLAVAVGAAGTLAGVTLGALAGYMIGGLIDADSVTVTTGAETGAMTGVESLLYGYGVRTWVGIEPNPGRQTSIEVGTFALSPRSYTMWEGAAHRRTGRILSVAATQRWALGRNARVQPHVVVGVGYAYLQTDYRAESGELPPFGGLNEMTFREHTFLLSGGIGLTRRLTRSLHGIVEARWEPTLSGRGTLMLGVEKR